MNKEVWVVLGIGVDLLMLGSIPKLEWLGIIGLLLVASAICEILASGEEAASP